MEMLLPSHLLRCLQGVEEEAMQIGGKGELQLSYEEQPY